MDSPRRHPSPTRPCRYPKLTPKLPTTTRPRPCEAASTQSPTTQGRAPRASTNSLKAFDGSLPAGPDAAIRFVVALHEGRETLDSPRGELIVEEDDIDHFGNRRLRTVGELIQNQLRTGLGRMERVVRDRMTTQDVEAITPQTLINIRPVVAALKEFFGTSQLSQFMDQTNPIAGLTHKRRLSALGPGGLSRDRAGMEVRDVHPSHYGRMCPIETPEGPNIGLIGSLASFARVNAFGFVETRTARSSRARHRPDRLPHRGRGRSLHRRPGERQARRQGQLTEERVLARNAGTATGHRPGDAIHYMDVSPRQMVSVATAMIPFLEHDDASRALMGSNMQRQAVPLILSRGPVRWHRHGVPRRGGRRRRDRCRPSPAPSPR